MSSVSKIKGVNKDDTQPSATRNEKAKLTSGKSAYGIATVNVLATAISRDKPPTDPQTRSDFCFDNLLSFLPHDEYKLLGVYRSLNVPSKTLRKWAPKGHKNLGENIIATLKLRRHTAPSEYQFARDHLYVWGFECDHDAWAQAGQEYARQLERRRRDLPEKPQAAEEAGSSGRVMNEALSYRSSKCFESREKKSTKAAENTIPETSRKPDLPGTLRQPKTARKSRRKWYELNKG
ncbi:uncharacterized protein ColSpa_07910 [Colletotrichum spaethianum]|uniref:Uncharacterized protein n=1 Tax=Colletotrichum spaethianum TaxID=700344 RepID=A0AA37UIC1_9PEZI|nr:uncharacterized protein ColSpa_07910 [Colletotrichum spaethianum]GKT47729.1 hypothetical protein ColSpa_07910 [Colletotrichum spaethianum]